MTSASKGRFSRLGADGQPAKLGIMGGTFDPIHLGHLRIAEEMREALGLDGVLFIPTGNPVFKKDQAITDAARRLEMCRLAVQGNPRFDVSSMEVDRAGDTFTVDTLRELRGIFPDNVAFHFIVGSDVAATIGKWRGVADISRLARLAVAVGRPGYAQADELRRAIEAAADFEYDLVDVTSIEVSSSDIRARVASGRCVRYLVVDEVRAYILDQGLYGGTSKCGARSCDGNGPLDGEGRKSASPSARDALSKEFLAARKHDLASRVSPKRLKHIVGVSETCKELAACYGVDKRKARLAGMLHDWDKGLDDEQARARVVELGMEDELDPWVVENMPRVLHGFTAARALGREFPEIPADVLQAVERHTTAAVDMTPLDMVLYIADAIEPSRTFGRIDELRAAVGKSSLEDLYFQTYEYWVFLLLERRQPLHPDTIRIWNAYAARRAREKGKKSK